MRTLKQQQQQGDFQVSTEESYVNPQQQQQVEKKML